MEVLAQVQKVVAEHALTIGLGLLVAVVLAGIAWYSMSRSSSGSKREVLVNQARVNEATLTPSVPQEGPGQEAAENQSDGMNHPPQEQEVNDAQE